MFILSIVVFINIIFSKCEKDTPISVEIRNGTIVGRTIRSLQNKTIYAFLEIPYAQPPVGSLRFKEPLPAKNWTGTLNTTRNTKICWETRFDANVYDPRQNEDCLYLNVYSPVLPGSNSSLPVWVYVYGGQFSFGHADYDNIDPQMIVDSGIVAVTLNYRSGPLGFLTTEDGVIPANLGLKDQHLALRWVQENIKFFGGDPLKVVLDGQSSGAVCVSHHVISSRSTGLFRGAIIQSASAIAHFAVTRRAKFFAYEMGKVLSSNFSESNSSQDLLNLLLEMPARTITYAHFPLRHLLTKNNTLELTFLDIYWKPVIERADVPNAYVTKPPHQSLITGDFQHIPLLTGITSEEALFYAKHMPLWLKAMEKTGLFFENDNIRWGFRPYVEKRMQKIYTTGSFWQKVPIMRYMSDYMFSVPSIRLADLHSRHAETYLYQFSYHGKMNDLIRPDRGQEEKGLNKVGHGEDLPYLIFYPGKASDVHGYPESDRFMQKRLTHLWSNFIKYLNPTPAKDFLSQYKIWPKLSKDDPWYFDIDTNVSVIKGFPRSYEQWAPIIENYFLHPLATL